MEFNQDKLETTFVEPITPYGPIEGRKYTLTHSDETGMMFLDIANSFNYGVINKDLRDELLGAWKKYDDNTYKLFFYAFVGNADFFTSLVKYNEFKKYMNLAIQAVIYGDKDLFLKNSNLLNSPIYVKFDSSVPIFNDYENYGYVGDYMLSLDENQ